jgi:undecaprenyl-phosphate alpha-N-acetylglucosaminyl 1-phosphatetransferase/UDP-N-acetylglucosamine 2-epimerase
MEHPRIIAASAIALAVTLFAIFSMRPWARKVGLVDRPDLRKQHNGRVPLIGGICFFIGTLVGLGYLGYLDRFVMSLMVGSALIVAVGVADDVANLSVRTRLFTESAIVGLVILSTGYFVDNFGGLLPADHFRIGMLVGIPLTIFAVIGLINAFNMLDGIDGLAASVAMVCIASVLMYDRAGWAFVGVMFMLQILFAALIPYILVNLGWPDGRKVFMGDAGSTVIGFLLGWSLIYLSHSRVGRLAPVDVLWCVALPVMDTMAVMYRRIRLGRSPFGADRQHLHHLMVDAGLSPRLALVLIVSGGASLAALGYLLRSAPDPVNLMAFVSATVLYVLGLPRLLELRKRGFVWRPSATLLRRQPLAAHLGATVARGSLVPSGEDHEPYPHPRQDAAPVRALCVVAATPESFGVAPIAQRLNADDRFDASVCLSDVPGVDGEAALKLFGLHADGRLTGEGGPEAMAAGVRELFQQVKPDVVLVPGNAPASFALSLAAHAEDVPVVCVDADSPAASRSQWPNDASRRIVQSLAALHIAASEGTGQRLLLEGVPAERVMVQDAISSQALHAGIQSLRQQPGLGRSLDKRFPFLREGHGLLLVLTAMPDATTGEGRADNESAVGEAIEMIARRRPDLDILWAMDALPAGDSPAESLRDFANVHIAQVPDYLAWIHLLDRAQLILAGPGVPCESRLLGKPVLLAREAGESDAADDRGCTVIGASPVTIAGRVLSVLSNEPEALIAMQVAAATRPADTSSGVLDALLRLHGGDSAGEGDSEPHALAYGVRQAS